MIAYVLSSFRRVSVSHGLTRDLVPLKEDLSARRLCDPGTQAPLWAASPYTGILKGELFLGDDLRLRACLTAPTTPVMARAHVPLCSTGYRMTIAVRRPERFPPYAPSDAVLTPILIRKE